MSTPSAGAVDDGEGSAVDSKSGATYSYLAPWYIPGWSAQLNSSGGLNYPALIPAAPAGLQFAPFPSDQSYTTIRQYYFSPDSDPLGGFLTFMPSDDAEIDEGGVSWRLPRRLSGSETWPAVDSGVSPWAFSMEGSGAIYIWRGKLIVKLLACDNPNLTTMGGQPLTYHVAEHFLGGYEYDISVPASGTVLDLKALIIPGSMTKYKYDPLYPMGTLEQQIGPVSTTPPSSPVRTYLFPAATNLWTAVHNYPYLPAVTCVDDIGNLIEGTVTYPDSTTVNVSWGRSVSGKMELR